MPTHDCSAAELDTATKNRLSHRGQALRKLQQLLMQTPLLPKDIPA
ncbi:MAG: non-canonical purine NTP pyrophosphatase [Thiolinea sp.]